VEIALVYLGSHKLPKYVLDNIQYLIDTFPNNQVTLISDNHRHLSKAEKIGAVTYLCKNYRSTLSNDYRDKSPDFKFRNGFWFLTFLRFFAIEEYMTVNKIENLLHVESDVLLLKTFPFERLSNLTGLAFPLVNIGYGVASTLFIKNERAITNLCKITKKLIFTNPNLTDMDVLGSQELYNTEHVDFLPSSAVSRGNFQDWVSEEDMSLMTSRIEYFGGIFDGMTWGQFLTGEDPRNHYGVRPIYRIQQHHSVRTSEFIFSFEKGKLLVRDRKGFVVVLHSLHIHSKDRRYFSWNKIDQILTNRSEGAQFGTRNEILFLLTIKMLPLRLINLAKSRARFFLSKYIA
jgi:hypothetical protein